MAIKVESLTYKDKEYELIPPAPTSTERGGIIASAKTSDYTTEVKLGSDGKLYVPEGGGVGSLSDLGITATATELNYVDGVTSNVQAQLNEKAWLSQAIANEGHVGQGETFDKNFLCIDLSNRLSTTNQRAYWYKPDDTGWINVPSGLEGLALGVREVFYYDKDHILVKITEFVPVQGRTWVNVYDYGWRGWKCYTDMSRGTLSSTANIDELSCGVYWCSLGSSNGGTIPVADYGVLEVMSNEDSIGIGNLQRFTTYSNGNKVYVRLRANGTWSSWKLLAVGDFLPLSGGAMNGHLNMNGHYIRNVYGTGNSAFNTGGIEIREQDGVANTSWDETKSPTLGFHWANIAAGTLIMNASGEFKFVKQNGDIATLHANVKSSGSWTYTKVVDSKYVGTVSTPVSSHQYFTAKGTVNGNVFTNTINLGDIGLWGSKSFSFAHGSSSCNFDITASSIKVTANGSVDDVSGYYMDK